MGGDLKRDLRIDRPFETLSGNGTILFKKRDSWGDVGQVKKRR
jgi:hypothetical protein